MVNINRPMELKPTELKPLLFQQPEEPAIKLSVHTGKLKFPGDESEYTFSASDLEDREVIGKGCFGTVSRMVHKLTGRDIAVKRIRSNSVKPKEQDKLIKELNTVMDAQPCKFIIKFFGAIFFEGDCWICMEVMDISLERLYKTAVQRSVTIKETIIGHIIASTVMALNYLKAELQIMHRDVKPSNVVMDRKGAVKLVDFGISGKLVDSIARTQDVGCKPYMAPERIADMTTKYDVRSDVWALGITLVEVVTGKFPYKSWSSIFEQLEEVVHGNAPVLSVDRLPQYSLEMIMFVNQCLTKDVESRPKYDLLMQTPFFKKYAAIVDSPETLAVVGEFVDIMLK